MDKYITFKIFDYLKWGYIYKFSSCSKQYNEYVKEYEKNQNRAYCLVWKISKEYENAYHDWTQFDFDAIIGYTKHYSKIRRVVSEECNKRKDCFLKILRFDKKTNTFKITKCGNRIILAEVEILEIPNLDI
jgi:hypothetical protein